MYNVTIQPGVGPDWEKVLEEYKAVLKMALLGYGQRSDGEVGEKYRELREKLNAVLMSATNQTCINSGMYIAFETWAQKQLGWEYSKIPNCVGLFSPGYDAYLQQVTTEVTDMRKNEDSEYTISQHLLERRRQYVAKITKDW